MAVSSKSVVNVGGNAPDFTLPVVVGPGAGSKEVSLSDYRGRKVIVFMWASW